VGNVNRIVFMAGERLPTIPLEEINLEKAEDLPHPNIRRNAHGTRYLKKDRPPSITFIRGQSAKSQSPAGG
jgi:hypothetical protein